jgi:hypothetical protein
VLAEVLVEDFPTVDLDSDAAEAARRVAQSRLPGLVVTDGSGHLRCILPASEVVRFLVPNCVQIDPMLAGVYSEAAADRVATKLCGKAIRGDSARLGRGELGPHADRGRRGDGTVAVPARRRDAWRHADRRDHGVPLASARFPGSTRPGSSGSREVPTPVIC